MLNRNIPGTDEIALVGRIKPDATTANTYSTAWVSMVVWDKVSALVMAGDLGAAAILSAKLEQAQDAAGAGVKDVPGKAITPLAHASAGSNKDAWINCRSNELDTVNSFTHVRLTMVIAEATSDAAAALFGMIPRYGDAKDHDAASVAEIVA